MKIHEFINVLEKDKVVPGKIVDKLRSKVEQSEKEVSAKSVAKYLVDKGYLSKYQVQQIFTAAEATADEIDLQVPQEQINDTNALLQELNPEPANPATDATRVFNENDVSASPGVVDVVDVVHEATMQQPLDMGDAIAQPMDAVAAFDPLGGGFDGSPAEAEEESPLSGFQGKKMKGNEWDSKWLFIGSSVLAVLVIVGVILAFTIFKADVEKSWEAVQEDFKNNRWAATIEKGEQFQKNFPNDDRAHDAEVMIANCKLRIPYEGKQWESALTQGKTTLPDLMKYLEENETPEKMADIRDDLGVILPGTAFGFTVNGLAANNVEEKKTQLAFALDAKLLVDNPSYVPTSGRKKPSVAGVIRDLEDNIKKIERQIQMEKDYVEAVETMKTLTQEGSTQEAFEVYDKLTIQYPILKVRDEIRQAVEDISLREADLVKVLDIELAAGQAPASIGKKIVLATRSGQAQIPGLGDEMLVQLVNGSVYGIKAATGEVVWRRFVGIETTIDPQWVGDPYRSDVIAADSRLNHIMRISYTDGKEIWRKEIGEPFVAPTIEPEEVLLATNSGKVRRLAIDSGASSKAAQIPKMASLSGFTIGDNPFIYQLGDNSNLYVISKSDMSCREVFYVGHDAGSIAIPPFVVAGHVIIGINGNNKCRLRVLKPTENGLKLIEAQPWISIPGQIHTPIARYNRWGILVSDTGEMKMLEINKADEEKPVTIVANAKFSNKNGSRRNFLYADSGKLWVCGKGLQRYKIIKNKGVFEDKGLSSNLDYFVAPGSLIEDTFFHVRRRFGSDLVSVSAVDSLSLKEIWRNDFAAPLAGSPFNDGKNDYTISAQGDVFRIDDEAIANGIINEPVKRASTTAQSLRFDDLLPLGERFVAVGPVEVSNVTTIDFERDIPISLTNMASPADKPASKPIVFGDSLLVSTQRGPIFRVDPFTGGTVGAPFGPPAEMNTNTNWQTPAITKDGQQFVIGNDRGMMYLVDADGTASLQKTAELEVNGELISNLLQLEGTVFGVLRNDNGDQLTKFIVGEGLEEAEDPFTLESRLVSGPYKISDSQFVMMMENGDSVCFDTELRQIWSGQIPPDSRDRMAGLPVEIDGKLMMAFQSGLILTVNPADGSITDSMNVGEPISGAPTLSNGRLLVPGADGTLHVITGN